MEEGTLQLAQTLARQSLRSEDEALEAAEAADGSPTPLRRPNNNHILEGKRQGFRYRKLLTSSIIHFSGFSNGRFVNFSRRGLE